MKDYDGINAMCIIGEISSIIGAELKSPNGRTQAKGDFETREKMLKLWANRVKAMCDGPKHVVDSIFGSGQWVAVHNGIEYGVNADD